jgi:hypothetical protein
MALRKAARRWGSIDPSLENALIDTDHAPISEQGNKFNVSRINYGNKEYGFDRSDHGLKLWSFKSMRVLAQN